MKKERMIFVPAAFLMTAMLAFPAMASEKIEEVTIDINAVLTDSDNLEVEADVSDDGCYVDEISITNEPSGDWNDDTKPKVKITTVPRVTTRFRPDWANQMYILEMMNRR